ncbi:MAG: matrixin family metalloprotease [bacterium]|nr:matrixin family metalloprotease [bacterium]
MKKLLRTSLLLLTVLLLIPLGGDRVHGFSYFSYGGVNVVWAGATSTRYLSPGTFPEGSEPDTFILASMGLWNLVPASDFEFTYARLAEDPVVDHFDGYSDTAAVPASWLDPGVLGVTYMVNNASQWFDMDIFFSDYPENVGWHFIPDPDCEVTSTPTPDNGFSFYLVAVHELGHSLGLGHDPIGDESPGTTWFIQTMNPRYPSGGPVGQQNIVELHTGDRNGIRFLYPHSGPSDPPVVDLAHAGYVSSDVIGRAVPMFFDTPGTLPEILPGEELIVRSMIENFGTTSEFSVRQGYYLSVDGTIDSGDLLIGDLLWDLAFEDALEFEVVIDMPEDIAAGEYYVGSIFDDLEQIAEEYEDNNAAVCCQTLTINQLAPVIDPLDQEIIPCGVPYAGPAPDFSHPVNMNPAVWSIDNPEPGMTIDPDTGALSWPDPVRSPFLYTIHLRATNSGGSSTQTLFVGVSEAPPEIEPIAAEEALCGMVYTGPLPAITSPFCMDPILNWSLDSGPAGMDIDYATGVVSWLNPIPSEVAYAVTIRATNAAGNGTQSWLLTVSGGDMDADGDVDAADYSAFETCVAGPGILMDAGCTCADFDADSDVDLVDYAAFALSYFGSSPEGACCFTDGSCVDGTLVECDTAAGSYLGHGTSCALDVCVGACCFDNGFCLDLSQLDCAGAPNTSFEGYGTECASTDCTPEPQGACCHPDESCTEGIAADCSSAGGVYQGDDTTCAGSDCTLAPTGACCDPVDWTCTVLTEADCTSNGGAYEGDDTTCAATTCPEYRNDIDPVTLYYNPGAGSAMADDITLSGADRVLVYYDLAVYGGDSGGGPFNVTAELYTDCPGNGGSVIPGTTASWTAVPDDGAIYTLSADLAAAPVTIPDTVWMVATFSTELSGWVQGEQAEVGSTADVFGEDDPPWGCAYAFDGSPPPHAGFWADLQCVPAGASRGAAGSLLTTVGRTQQAGALRALRIITDED